MLEHLQLTTDDALAFARAAVLVLKIAQDNIMSIFYFFHIISSSQVVSPTSNMLMTSFFYIGL
jgi:hypothetical protein